LVDRKAVGNVVFIGSVVVLLAIVMTVGFVACYDLERVQTENNALQANFQNLQLQLGQLQSEYDQLNNQYQQLLARVASDKGIQINSLAIRNDGDTSVVVRNMGSTDVYVTSLKLYQDQILQSSKDVFVIVPANSTTKIDLLLPPAQYSSSYLYTFTVVTLEGYTACLMFPKSSV
jgi:FtsZ-binding cell division protein ZapB